MTLPIVLVPHPHVRVEPKVLGGSPHVAGTRVPVRRLWAFYRNGTSLDTLLRRFPQLGPAKVLDALAFAFDNQEVIEADFARERALLDSRGPRGRAAAPASQMELPLWNDASVPATAPAAARSRSARRSSGQKR